ncbi:MAG: CHRD domain-containing protein [Myxococcales bacterium]|nr:MAG: CHRD domain-containing protein [Myxococcales bacterium]
MIRRLLVAAVAIFIATSAGRAYADTHVWDMTCSEDQVSNSGVGDGSTDSAATGTASTRYDALTQRLFYDVSYAGLEGLLTNIHIHGPAPLGAGNPNHVFDIFSGESEVLEAGVDRTSDRVSSTDSLLDLILGSNGVGLGTVEENAQVLIDDLAYVNIHTDIWPAGEIRCQFVTTQVLTDAEQAKDQQKCTRAMIKGLGRVASTKGKSVCKCVNDFTGGKLSDLLENCVATDDSKVGKAQAKVTADFGKRCTGNDKDGITKLPAFGVTDDPTVNSVASLWSAGIPHAIFGPDLDVAVDDGTDPDLGSCQVGALKALKKCRDTRVKEYDKCVNGDLKGKVGLTIVDVFGMEQCLGSDAKGKIAGACDATTGKLREAVEKACSGVDLLTAFPLCAAGDTASTAACLDRVAACGTCLATNASTGSALDCDVFDDGLTNGSCSP